MTKPRVKNHREIKSFNVIGAGAVGCFYGGKLAQHGHSVHFFSKSNGQILNQKSIKVKSIWGNFLFKADFYDDAQKMPPADIVLVCIKALPSVDYKKLLATSLRPDSIIVLLQNGIYIEEQIAQVFPKHSIVAALAFTCINRIRPNLIDHSDYGHVKIAPASSKVLHQKQARELAAIFQGSQIPTEYHDNHLLIRWQKLVWNIAFNPLSVSVNADTKLIIENEQTYQLAYTLMREVQSIAKADKVDIGDEFIQTMLDNTVKMRPYLTSMLLDYRAGKPLELAAILANPLQRAKQKKIAAPAMTTLYQIVQLLDLKNQSA